jgi:hypothetical protein
MSSKDLPLPGQVFAFEDCTAFLISAGDRTAKNKPWVWYAPTLAGLPGSEEKWMFQKFADAGISIAGIDVGESYGSPDGRAHFTSFYQELVNRGFSKTPCLLARSRGGLMLYNWAAEHPSSVACIAGIYPVCDLTSYPGLGVASNAYHMTADELTSKLNQHNPIERLEPLAKAHVHILHIHGDKDDVVPLERNSGEMAKRYAKLGGEMTLNVVKDGGHTMWSGWFECQALVDFIITQAGNSKPSK